MADRLRAVSGGGTFVPMCAETCSNRRFAARSMTQELGKSIGGARARVQGPGRGGGPRRTKSPPPTPTSWRVPPPQLAGAVPELTLPGGKIHSGLLHHPRRSHAHRLQAGAAVRPRRKTRSRAREHGASRTHCAHCAGRRYWRHQLSPAVLAAGQPPAAQPAGGGAGGGRVVGSWAAATPAASRAGPKNLLLACSVPTFPSLARSSLPHATTLRSRTPWQPSSAGEAAGFSIGGAKFVRPAALRARQHALRRATTGSVATTSPPPLHPLQL